MTPEISVVMPTHNVGPWLRECLSSILDDQDVDLELIVIDDASTDDTPRVLADRSGDRRLHVVPNPGHGGAAGRNEGARLARGEFLAFCDGDDLVPRGAYAAMLRAARASGSDMVVGSFLKFFPSRTWRPTQTWPAFDEDRTATTLVEQPSLIYNRACWNRLFRRDFWQASGIEFPSVPRSNDIVPMTRALVAAGSIDVIRDTVYLYRSRPGETSMTARARGATGLLSYLDQERISMELTAAVGDAALAATHRELFLQQDGWVHLQNFLAGPDFAASGAEELDELQARITEMYGEEGDGLLTDLPGPLAGYTLVRRGRWAEASQLARGIVGEGPQAAVPVLLTAAEVAPLGELSEDLVRGLVLAHVVRPLTLRVEPCPELAPLLVAHRDLLTRLFDGQDLTGLRLAEQHLLAAALTGREEAVAAVLRETPVRVAFRRMLAEGSETRGRLAVGLPDDATARVYARAGDRRHDLPILSVVADGVVEVDVPFSDLVGASWELRVAVAAADLTVDAPVALSPVAPERIELHGVTVTPASPGEYDTVLTFSAPPRRRWGRWRRGSTRRPW